MKRLVRKSVFEPQFLVLFTLPLTVKMDTECCKVPGSSGMNMPFHLKYADVCPLQEDMPLEKTYNSPIECGLKCLQDAVCVGYNYRKGTLKKNSNCQLTHTLDHDSETCNKSDKKWTFYQAVKKREVPCNKIKNCKNGGKTVIGPQDPGSVVTNSCASWYISGEREDGVYNIDPNHQGPFQVRCDMRTDGGGWTVFQRRLDGSVNFYLEWQAYKDGFGDLNGEFWLGLDKIHRLTKSGQNVLRVDLMDFDNTTAHAKYGTFTVASESDGYRLNVGSFSGSAGDSLNYHNGMKFSTKDRDNDQTGSSCAVDGIGAWWYTGCLVSNLNSKYLTPSSGSGPGISWYYWKRDYRSMKTVEMKIRPAQF